MSITFFFHQSTAVVGSVFFRCGVHCKKGTHYSFFRSLCFGNTATYLTVAHFTMSAAAGISARLPEECLERIYNERTYGIMMIMNLNSFCCWCFVCSRCVPVLWSVSLFCALSL